MSIPEEICIHGHKIFHYSTTDSTNLRVKAFAEAEKHGTIALADEQTAGRGRMNRSWCSKAGQGAWFSCLIKPDSAFEAQKAPGLVFVAALSLTKSLRAATNADIRIKWPNDLVLNGKKLCGIMCEMRAAGMLMDYAVIGIGVNLQDGDFLRELPFASSLQKETGISLTPQAVVKGFLHEFDEMYARFLAEGLRPTLDAIKPFSITLHSRVTAYLPEGSITGTATDFREDGALLIETENGIRAVEAGDVSVRGVMGYV